MSFSRSIIFTRRITLLVAVPLFVGGVTIVSSAQESEKKDTPTTPPAAAITPTDGQFIEEAPNEQLKNTLPKIKQMLQAGKFGPGEDTIFTDYFENYEFKRWTQEKNLSRIADWRSQLTKMGKSAKPGPPRDRFNELVLEILGKKVKNKKYHPVFRMNAILAIGDLNASEGGPGTALVPYPPALQVLLDTLDDAQQLDAVKVAALVGIKRHVLCGAKEPSVAKAAMKLASVDDSDTGKAWMRVQAIEILGGLQSPGNGNEVIKLLQSIIADSKAATKLRLAAADALGQLNLANAAGLKADELIAALARLMKDGCNAELKNVQDENGSISPRMIRTFHGAVMAGLGDSTKGLKSFVKKDSPEAKKIAELEKILKETLTALDKEDVADDDIQKAVETEQKKLGESMDKKE